MISLWLFVDPLIKSIAHLRIPAEHGARVTRETFEKATRPIEEE